MNGKYKLLYIETVDTYADEDTISKDILKDSSDWVELSQNEVDSLVLYLRDKYGYTWNKKYILIQDVSDKLHQLIKEGVKVGQKMKEEQDKRKAAEKERALKRKQVRDAKKKKQEAVNLEKAKKLLQEKGLI